MEKSKLPEEIEKRIAEQNDGLESVDTSTCLERKLQVSAPVEKPASESPENEESIPSETSISEDGPYRELAYLCVKAQVNEKYKTKLDKKLDDLLEKHDFIKENWHYERIRGEVIDYLFLEKLGKRKEEGTFGISVKVEEFKDFELCLETDPRKEEYFPILRAGGYGIFGTMVGFIGGLVAGLVTLSIVGEPYATYIVLGATGIGTKTGAITGYITCRIDKSKEEERYNSAVEEKEQLNKKYLCHTESPMLFSPKQYDFKIIKHFLDLTPDFIVNKNE